MGKHAKKRHRRIVIAVVAIGTVGVPSVAMACTDWQDSGRDQLHSAEKTRAKDWSHHADRGRDWRGAWGPDGKGGEESKPTPTASKTPTAAANTPKATAPKPKSAAPSSSAKATASASARPTPPSTPKATATATGTAARVVQLVNAERAKAGCSAVTVNATLTKAAQAHSADMAAHRNMSHTGSDGSSPGDRITRAGYIWSTYGENVAYGYATPEQVMAGWMSSPGHKANILNCAFKEIGVGLAQPNDYWTQDFGTAR
ncbi:CAP domain-containing protein [Streptomyces sp. NPDC002888]|uniref:CAP domain-containing protein n=1 Tax=Streptomyces sp. NPDC002888 TaxID=3364668 RepID=UPI00367A053C